MIKFRAWDRQTEMMLGSDNIYLDITFNGEVKWQSTDDVSQEFELMQYTGLNDKNGTPIYEGDIIRFCDFASDRTGGHMGDSILTGEVTYDYAVWLVKFSDDVNEPGFFLCDAHLNDDELEVIGNKFEGIKEESK